MLTYLSLETNIRICRRLLKETQMDFLKNVQKNSQGLTFNLTLNFNYEFKLMMHVTNYYLVFQSTLECLKSKGPKFTIQNNLN